MKETDQMKLWRQVLEFPVSGRHAKPRHKGLTMVIDKGLGLTEVRDLLDIAADYIDLIKLGFGTSALYSGRMLQQKIQLVKSSGVDIFPGGTFLEVAVLQGKLDQYLEMTYAFGYTCVEVSDGTIEMSRRQRLEAINKARALGLKVITEVGKKDPRDQIASTAIVETIGLDLANGAYKVIVEGRESGKGVGLYDGQGALKEDELEELIDGIHNPEDIIWEAPLKNQQQALIDRFGPNVNLGNIQPGEIMSLEALRVGLRGDTLRSFLGSPAGKVFTAAAGRDDLRV
ncbi:MAG: phosphosulfolactate synthase [Bacillota bacterium]